MKWFALALLALAACVPPHFVVDPTFEPELATVEEAVGRWNTITNAGHQIDLNGDDWTIRRGTTPEGNRGWTDPLQHTVTISWAAEGRDLYALTLHEVGHSLGLFHVADGVMQHNVTARGDRLEFTAQDLAECKRVRACD